ncbi:cysteine hydrolase [bacterium]|nr:cysteine hydrolase [bacterium]
MSVTKYFLLILGIVVILVISVLLIMIRQMFTPTQGDSIGPYHNPREALLVIDVQEDMTGLHGKQPVPFKEVDHQIACINGLIDQSTALDIEVVYIRHLFDDNVINRTFVGRALEGQPGTELDPRINKINNNDFTKKKSDAFSNPQLSAFLIENQVDRLYLVGLDAAYCVYYTALGALNRGYKVTAINDGLITAKNLEAILTRYEENGILVLSSQELIEQKRATPSGSFSANFQDPTD